MSTASKSPRKVAAVAFELAARTLPQYSHRFSRRDFTQPQLVVCLVLRKFFRTDYRGIMAILTDMPRLCQDVGLKKLPHFTTLQKAERRLLRDTTIRRMLEESVDLYDAPEEAGEDDHDEARPALRQGHDGEVAAADSTGFELRRGSRYYVKRRSKGCQTWEKTHYRRYGKLNIVCDCSTHLILSTLRGQGPKVDVNELHPLLMNICRNVVPAALLADAGFDSEANHELLRDDLAIASHIPAVAKRYPQSLPQGRWRYTMATAFDEETYNQRWQAETVMFMLKCHQGAALTARTYQTRRREMGLMTIVHNAMIVLLAMELFYRAGLTLLTPRPC